MIRRFGLLAGVCATLAACASAGSGPSLRPSAAGAPFVAGYHPWWAGDAWQQYPFDVLDELYFFEAEVDARGRISEARGWPDRWSEMADRAREAGVQVVPTISMHGAGPFEAVFADDAVSGALVDEALALFERTPGLAGLHVDVEVFEPVRSEAREGFTAFVRELGRRLHERAPGATLSLFLLAFDDDDAYDEPALAGAADFVVVQGYDYHSLGSPSAGPVGATSGWGRLNWRVVLERMDAFGIPREKVVMGVPLYGYEWPVDSERPGAATRGPGRAVPLVAPADVLPGEPRATERAAEHGVRRDPESGTPWYAFRSADGWWQGWYEDAESLRSKYDFVLANRLGGIAFFPLAYGSDEVWAGVRSVLR